MTTEPWLSADPNLLNPNVQTPEPARVQDGSALAECGKDMRNDKEVPIVARAVPMLRHKPVLGLCLGSDLGFTLDFGLGLDLQLGLKSGPDSWLGFGAGLRVGVKVRVT